MNYEKIRFPGRISRNILLLCLMPADATDGPYDAIINEQLAHSGTADGHGGKNLSWSILVTTIFTKLLRIWHLQAYTQLLLPNLQTHATTFRLRKLTRIYSVLIRQHFRRSRFEPAFPHLKLPSLHQTHCSFNICTYKHLLN